jgi:hypothetical protein
MAHTIFYLIFTRQHKAKELFAMIASGYGF